MKKITLSVLSALFALWIFTSVASAQGDQPPQGGRTIMREYTIQALAEKLDLQMEDVQSRLDAGDYLWQVALDNGITEETLPDFMQEIHEDAVALALADGAITQAQAELMLQRMAARHEKSQSCPRTDPLRQDGFGPSHGNGRRGGCGRP